MSAPEPKGSWSDNRSVSALSDLARGVDQLAGLLPDVEGTPEAAPGIDTDLPLQNLPAHVIFARHWETHRARLLASLTSRPCPLCGGTSRSPWFNTQDGYRYDTCADCGMVHVPEVLPMTAWDAYYATLPGARECLHEQLRLSIGDEAVARDRVRFGRYLALLRALGAAPVGARLLDLGSFTGGWIRAATDEGLEAYGLEGLAEAVEFAKTHFPDLRIEHGRTEDLTPEAFGGRFDVVTMWETLEHTVSPVASLRLAAQALRPDGWIAVTVPNAINVQFSALGPYCFYAYGGYQGPGHLNMFSPRTLTQALEAAGFTLVHLSSEYGTDWRQVLYFLRHEFDRLHCYRNLIPKGKAASAHGLDLSILLSWLSPSLTRLENACVAGPILVAIARRRASMGA